MNDILTPLQALEALLDECDKSMDYRPAFRLAMSNAFTSIVNAKAKSTNLGAPLEVGDDDCDLTFSDLFGEPDPSAFNPKVLDIVRGMAAADRSPILEAIHG